MSLWYANPDWTRIVPSVLILDMGYFGGLGKGKGWSRYSFSVAPTELEENLARFQCLLLVHNQRVPVGYERTLIAEYARSLHHHLRNPPGPSEAYAGLHIAVLDPTTPYEWQPVPVRRKGRDEGFKVINFKEPIVSFVALQVAWLGETLSVGCSYRDSAWIGLEMHFPKVVSFADDGYRNLHDSGAFRNAGLFSKLRLAINAITFPAVFDTPAGRRRPRIRVSNAAAKLLQGNASLERHALNVGVAQSRSRTESS